MDYVVGLLIGLILGGGAVFGLLQFLSHNVLNAARAQAEQVKKNALAEAETRGKEIELAAQQKQLKVKEQFEAEQSTARRRIEEQENRLEKVASTIDRKLDTLSVKERNLDDLDAKLNKQRTQLAQQEGELKGLLDEERKRLLQIADMSADQAKEMLLARVENECRGEVGAIVNRYVHQAEEEGKDRARQIILQAIQRYASEQTADHTVSTVTIPSDDMKGRVIGREGRNIRAFEKATGVDIIIDDTPGMVVVSCFDPVRREIARISLERLVTDGRIHPARIEEVVAGVTQEMEENLVKLGKSAIQEANLPNLPRPLLPVLGRLNFRTSYGQNVLKHSLEVAYISQVIAAELGLDPELARRAGLLDDIGKAMDHEQEGGHPQIGYDFLKKLGEGEAVLNAAAGHHGDVPASTPYTVIVMAADAISASRPGARRESLERYIKRLQDLEELAKGFDGVRQAYAIQAGREVRVIVDAKQVDDKVAMKIARDVAKKIETDMQYPGEIKVTLIREVRAVEYAR